VSGVRFHWPPLAARSAHFSLKNMNTKFRENKRKTSNNGMRRLCGEVSGLKYRNGNMREASSSTQHQQQQHKSSKKLKVPNIDGNMDSL
jgi:hypothetical protein